MSTRRAKRRCAGDRPIPRSAASRSRLTSAVVIALVALAVGACSSSTPSSHTSASTPVPPGGLTGKAAGEALGLTFSPTKPPSCEHFALLKLGEPAGFCLDELHLSGGETWLLAGRILGHPTTGLDVLAWDVHLRALEAKGLPQITWLTREEDVLFKAGSMKAAGDVVPTQLLVSCGIGRPSVQTEVVRTQPDGLHWRVEADAMGSFAVFDGAPWSSSPLDATSVTFHALAESGFSEGVFNVAPGLYWVTCSAGTTVKVADVKFAQSEPFLVLPPQGWMPSPSP